MRSRLAERLKVENAERRREQLESAPDELRPHLEALLQWRDSAVKTITAKNSLVGQIQRLRKALHDRPEDPQAPAWRDRLAQLEIGKGEAELKVEAVKEEALRVETGYQDRVLEHRIAAIPEARREEARSLLLEERRAIFDASQTPPASGGEVGAAGGTVFALEFRIERSRTVDNDAEVGRLTALLEPARAEKARVEAVMRKHHAEIEAIRSQYAARLRETFGV